MTTKKNKSDSRKRLEIIIGNKHYVYYVRRSRSGTAAKKRKPTRKANNQLKLI